MIILCHQALITEETPPKLLAFFAMEVATEQGKFKRGPGRKVELQDKLILPFVHDFLTKKLDYKANKAEEMIADWLEIDVESAHKRICRDRTSIKRLSVPR